MTSSEFTEMMRQLCARCGAKPGEHCRTASGSKSPCHVPRWYAALRARKAAAGLVTK